MPMRDIRTTNSSGAKYQEDLRCHWPKARRSTAVVISPSALHSKSVLKPLVLGLTKSLRLGDVSAKIGAPKLVGLRMQLLSDGPELRQWSQFKKPTIHQEVSKALRNASVVISMGSVLLGDNVELP